MKATQLASLGIIPAALLTIACGDDVTKVTKIEETSGLEVVASADSLGKCTEEISGEMKFASKENAVYICADSAWKNVSEAEKTVCTAEALADSSGFKIVCDGDSIGVVKNGANGKTGAKGDDGKDGEGCKLVDGPVLEEGNSLVQTSFVVCGKDTVGTISDGRPGEGCDISDGGDGTVSVVCGDASTTLYKALCGGKVYNPDSNFCFADSVVALCGGERYDLDESFCAADSIVPLCGGKTYDLDSSFCLDGKVYKNKTLVWDLMNPEIEYGVFVDERDDQVYRSVKIGEQTWMAENLNYAYLQKTSSLDSSSLCYNNEPDSCAKYGRLYLWSAAMDSAAVFSKTGMDCGYEATCHPKKTVRGVCPKGWHLPSIAEFETLVDAVGGKSVAGKALKSISGWSDYNGNSDNGTDSFGFSALPAGLQLKFNLPIGVGVHVLFWSATAADNRSAYKMSIRYDIDKYVRDVEFMHRSFSVRCVKD